MQESESSRRRKRCGNALSHCQFLVFRNAGVEGEALVRDAKMRESFGWNKISGGGGGGGIKQNGGRQAVR